MSSDWSTLSLRRQRALAILPKCTSSISMVCTLLILHELYDDHRRRGTSPVQRALAGMSIIDLMASSAWFLSTWAVPEGEFALSKGNRGSCSFQGFLLQLAVGAPLYNCSLALYYLLIIKYSWTDSMLENIERWVHTLILSFSIGTAILLLPLKQYNHIGTVCWVIGDPIDCESSTYGTSSGIPCERGKHAWIYGFCLFYGPLWLCVFGCIGSMYFIYWEVRKTHARLRRYITTPGSSHSLRRSQNDLSNVASQAILYTISFFITWMPSTLWSIAHWFEWKTFWLDVASAFCEPLQGFWNFLVFARGRKRTKNKIKRLFVPLCPQTCILDEEISDTSMNGRRTSRNTTSVNHGVTRTSMSQIHGDDGDCETDNKRTSTSENVSSSLTTQEYLEVMERHEQADCELTNEQA